jgi:hypothetical protein
MTYSIGTHLSLDWLERSNTQTLYHLERQGRTSPGLVPFLGAGISTPFRYQAWKTLLTNATPPRLAHRIKKRLQENNYEGAAEALLKELGPDGFQHMVAASAGDNNLQLFDFGSGTVSLQPLPPRYTLGRLLGLNVGLRHPSLMSR